jgi:hypothetical protein
VRDDALRLRSDFWVQATLRRWQGEGLFAAVIYKGSPEAGAVYVVVNHLDGGCDLLSPPPGPAHNEDGERHFWRETKVPLAWPEISERMLKRRSRDPDIWLVEVEDRTGCGGLLLAKE